MQRSPLALNQQIASVFRMVPVEWVSCEGQQGCGNQEDVLHMDPYRLYPVFRVRGRPASDPTQLTSLEGLGIEEWPQAGIPLDATFAR